MRRIFQAAVTVATAAMLLGCGPTAKEKKVIEDLTSKMKTICIGRFVMNVPQDVKIKGDVKGCSAQTGIKCACLTGS
jgi:hypothetical protein